MSLSVDPKHSLRTRITLLALALLLGSLGLLAWYSADLLRSDIRQQAALRQTAAVSALAQRLDDQLRWRLHALARAAGQLTVDPQGDALWLQQHLQAQSVLAGLFGAGVRVFDVQGQVLADTTVRAGSLPERLPLTPDDLLLLEAIDGAAVARGPLGADATTVTLVAPLPREANQPRRWLAGALDLRDLLGPQTPGQDLGETPRQWLVSPPQRLVLARLGVQPGAADLAPAAQEAHLNAVLTASSGVPVTQTLNTEAVMLTVADLSAAPWRVAQVQLLRDVMQPLARVQQRLWGAAALLALLLGGLAWWVIRRQFKPLTAAAHALTQMTQAQALRQPLPDDAQDEVGVLMKRINRLLEQIRARERDLDAQTDELGQINQQLQAILQHVPQLVWLKDLQGSYITCNARFETFFNVKMDTLHGRTDQDIFTPEQVGVFRADDQRCLQSKSMDTVQHWLRSAQSEQQVLLEVNRIALRDEEGRAQAILGIGQDITERWRQDQFEQLRSKVLEQVVLGAALPDLLQSLADGLHAIQSEWSCALMRVLDTPEGKRRLRVAAAAGLAPEMMALIDATWVTEGVCGCATAAATGKPVVESDIAHGFLSQTYRDCAQRAGVGSCWAQPMRDFRGRVIGVFSVYQRAARAPGAADLDLLMHLARLAEIALDRDHAGKRLRASEASFRALSERTPEAVLVHRHGQILFANPAAVRMFGAESVQHLQQKSLLDLVAPECLAHHKARMLAIERGEPVEQSIESCFLHLDGSAFDAEVKVTAVTFDGVAAMHVSVRDVTQRNETSRQLQLAASVFEHALEGIIITDAAGRIEDVNAAFTRITGYSRDEVLGRNPSLLQSGRHEPAFYRQMWDDLLRDGHWSGEMCNRRKDGQIYVQLLHISTIRNAQGELSRCVGLLSDITERKHQEERLSYLAHFDALTGLPNRTLHADRLRQAMANVMRRHKKLAVAFIDLDGFKAVNDTFGHDAGDHVLVTLAQRMRQALREVDTLSRIGGDEFAAIIVDLEFEADCDPLLKRLLAAANEPVAFGGHQLQVSASVGVTFYPQHDGQLTADQLLQQADLAMYSAKHEGKNQVRISGFADL